MPSLEDYARIADDVVLSPERLELVHRVAKNEAFYDGHADKYMRPHEAETAADFKARPKPPSNVSKRVVNTFIGHLYGKKIRRSFQDETNDAILQDILGQQGNLMAEGMNWQRKAELSGYAVVIPRYDMDRGRFFLHSYSSTDVVPICYPADPCRLQALVISYRMRDEVTKKVQVYKEVWTEDEFAAYVDDAVMVNAAGPVAGPHGFGEVPAAFFHSDMHDGLVCPRPSMSDVVDMHDHLLQLLSTWAEVIRYQGFNIIFEKNLSLSEVVASPKRWISSNHPDSDAKVLQFQADTQKLIESVKSYFAMIGDIGEVPAFSLTGTASVESGLALAIKFVPHQQAIDRRMTFYTAGELTLARLWLKLADMVGYASPNLDRKALQAAVDYPRLGIPLTVDERIAINQHRLQLGLTNPVQLLLEENPEMDEDMAAAEVEQNLAETKRLRGLSVTGLGGLDALAKAGLAAGRAQAAEDNPAADVEA